MRARFFDWYYRHYLDYVLRWFWTAFLIIVMLLAYTTATFAALAEEWSRATWHLLIAFILSEGLKRPR